MRKAEESKRNAGVFNSAPWCAAIFSAGIEELTKFLQTVHKNYNKKQLISDQSLTLNAQILCGHFQALSQEISQANVQATTEVQQIIEISQDFEFEFARVSKQIQEIPNQVAKEEKDLKLESEILAQLLGDLNNNKRELRHTERDLEFITRRRDSSPTMPNTILDFFGKFSSTASRMSEQLTDAVNRHFQSEINPLLRQKELIEGEITRLESVIPFQKKITCDIQERIQYRQRCIEWRKEWLGRCRQMQYKLNDAKEKADRNQTQLIPLQTLARQLAEKSNALKEEVTNNWTTLRDLATLLKAIRNTIEEIKGNRTIADVIDRLKMNALLAEMRKL